MRRHLSSYSQNSGNYVNYRSVSSSAAYVMPESSAAPLSVASQLASKEQVQLPPNVFLSRPEDIEAEQDLSGCAVVE